MHIPHGCHLELWLSHFYLQFWETSSRWPTCLCSNSHMGDLNESPGFSLILPSPCYLGSQQAARMSISLYLSLNAFQMNTILRLHLVEARGDCAVIKVLLEMPASQYEYHFEFWLPHFWSSSLLKVWKKPAECSAIVYPPSISLGDSSRVQGCWFWLDWPDVA